MLNPTPEGKTQEVAGATHQSSKHWILTFRSGPYLWKGILCLRESHKKSSLSFNGQGFDTNKQKRRRAELWEYSVSFIELLLTTAYPFPLVGL